MDERDRWKIVSHEFEKLDLYISKYKLVMSLVLNVDDYDRLHRFFNGL